MTLTKAPPFQQRRTGHPPGALHADGGGCTLSVDREVKTEIPVNRRESMKSTARWSIAVVMVGMFVLILGGQTQSDVVVAQGRKPVMMYRFYEGTDGLSHVESIEIKNFNEHDVANLMAVTGAEIHRTKPSAPACGRAARPASPPWAASSPT